MQMFIEKPSIALYPGVVVTKDTVLTFERENVRQTVNDLVLHSETRVKGDNYDSVMITNIQLEEGDILIFEEEGRGYIKPVASFVTVDEAIRELEIIKP